VVRPGEPAFYNAIHSEHIQEAQDASRRGRDPLPYLEWAEAAARQAVAAAPDQGFGHSNVGHALLQRADHERQRGGDPMPAARAAEAAFTQALERLPDHSTIWLNLATLHVLVAGLELDRRRDPRPRLALAGTAIERALALNPNEPQAGELRAEARALLERWQRGAAPPRAIR
jgi:tetratricopeptide (TPR) repeat protein